MGYSLKRFERTNLKVGKVIVSFSTFAFFYGTFVASSPFLWHVTVNSSDNWFYMKRAEPECDAGEPGVEV